MFHKCIRLAILGLFASILFTWGFGAQPVASQGPSSAPATTLRDAVQRGKYPAQIVGQSGNIRPDQHGPQRTTKAEGISKHAYSPFDDKNTREFPCPPGGCDFQKGRVVVKMAPTASVRAPTTRGAWTDSAVANKAMLDQGVVRLEPVFPNARAPRAGATIVTPQGTQIAAPDLTRWYRAVLQNENADVFATADVLGKTAGVAWAEPDYLRKPVGSPTDWLSGLADPAQSLNLPGPGTDPLYSQQWHLGAVNAPQAWAYLESQGLPPGGNRNIVVAVIDTGVDYNHPDLAANMWTNSREISGNGIDDDGNGFVDDVHGANVVSGAHGGDPMDDHGHGTHVAGIIAAQSNNGRGGVGIAYNVQMMAIKAAQYSGVLSVSDIAAAINYATANGADVINMSFGGYARSQLEEDALAVAFGQAVLVAAAGNDGKVNLPCPLGRDMYPAAYNWVLGVMASTSGGSRALFSNSDCIPHDTHEYELMAPGVDVMSTLPSDQYAAWDGTSMSAPIVSGIAALVRTKFADKNVYSSRFIMGQIASNALPVANAYAALTAAPKPELSYLEHWLFDTTAQSATNDNDGIVDAGETVDLAVVIRNHWGTADPVNVTLAAWAEGAVQPDPYVTMITSTVNYGAVGAFNVDDNGLIYDAQGVVTGVRYPFRFAVASNTPNDHVIPFRLTMTAGNGLNPADPSAPYTFQSRFNQIVMRGRELPRTISQDMVLTKDDYWILSNQTLIQAGATVTITEGTQLQFGSPDPASPYTQSSYPYLQVEGSLLVQGSPDWAVEFFGARSSAYRRAEIRNYGTTTLSYAKVNNPILGVSVREGYGPVSAPLTSIVHGYFSADRIMGGNSFDSWRVSSNTMSRSVLNRMPGEDWISTRMNVSGLRGNMNVDTSLINIIPYKLYEPGQPVGGEYRFQRFSDWYTSFNGAMSDSVLMQSNEYEASILVWLGGSGNSGLCTNCAFLSKFWDPDVSHWMRFRANEFSPRGAVFPLENNYWGTTSANLIDSMIYDFNDDFNIGSVSYQPILTTPATTTFPFVVDVRLSTAGSPRTSTVGAEAVTFTVTYNRDMDTTVQPAVSFGPDLPNTDYTIHPINGGWSNAHTWVGTFNVTPTTGDGYQLIRVAGARAADDHWLVTGDDAGRFRFEVITSGTESMNLQANGGEGRVNLSWTQNDFDLLAGYNLYRSTTSGGTYSRINSSIIPPATKTYTDTNVTPGIPYYYKFTVVKSDMSESNPSNIATATPLDTIPPMITHTPITSAPPGLSLTIGADVTDNVAVQSVWLYSRPIGAVVYAGRPMTRVTGNRYTATIEGQFVTSPGIEYFIQATDGVSTVRFGRAEFPYQITVVDRPVVTAVSPLKGPASGGTTVTIAGSNFKSGATSTFGGSACGGVTFISTSQITCTTPIHFPAVVDVTVTNPDLQSGTLLRGYTFESDTASASLPNTGGEQNAIVQVPINLANVNGMVAADMTVTFSSTVLIPRTASTGSLTPGWSVITNTNTLGQIRLAMASAGGTSSGTGTLALLEFEVKGSPGMTSTLHLANLSLNDGAIPTQTADGSFLVNLANRVSGTVRSWNASAGVSNTLLSLVGDRVYGSMTSATGVYTVTGAPAGTYTLTPSKSDGVNGITAYDASLVLQHSAGLITLSGYPATAADVDKSGAITSMDAFYILQKSVDLITLPFPGAGVVWNFNPTNRSYPSLASDQSGQDFTGVLLGDVSGNWSATAPSKSVIAKGNPVVVRVIGGSVSADGVVTATVWLDPGSAPVYSLDLRLTHDTARATPLSVNTGALASAWWAGANLDKPGEVRVAMAGARPLAQSGAILTLRYRLSSPIQVTALQLTRGDINEGAITAQLMGGGLNGSLFYLPMIGR